MEKVIEVKDLKREYITTKGWLLRKKSTLTAVDGIDFNVNKGEIFGLLGENGAGKTTTIKMLITLLAPTSGVCKVLGFDTYKEADKIREKINFVFGGEMGVYRRLSARDNLLYFAGLYKIKGKEAKKRTEELLKLVELEEAADRLVETYSKGMIQRLQISRKTELYMNLIEIPLVFLCGFTFPIEVLPSWAQSISNLLAPTWAVKLLRMSVGVVDTTVYMEYVGILLVELLVLVIFTIGLYNWMDKRVRIQATLEVS